MASVAIYLNFQGNCEEAFNYYKTVFNTEFEGGIMRMNDIPSPPETPAITLPEHEQKMIMHICLPIIGGVQLMGTDMLESMGHKLIVGNNTTISLQVDSKEEADKYYNLLAIDTKECMPMSQQFWGYWGCCLDRFGVRWMFNYFGK